MNNINKHWGIAAIALTMAFSFVLSLTGCDNSADSPESAVVSLTAIRGVTVPVNGETPVTTITENAQYRGTVTWSPNHATFAANTAYTATITLTEKTGYTLQGVARNYFKVAGATATNDAGSGVITAVFPPTGAPAVINIAAISGVTAPATGETPVTTITEDAQYSGMVTWSPNHATFAANTAYTATITLTAKTGYTLQGVARNFFTVTGATATNDAGSGVITAKFPQAAKMLTVTNVTEWTNACNQIAVGGNGTSDTPKTYVIMISGNIVVPVVSQTFGSVFHVVVTLQGNGTLSSDSQGNMIKTSSDQTLVIDSPNLTLQGPANNNAPFIYCAGKLEMKNGTISGNVTVNSDAFIYGGAVYANDFTMSGGSIRGSSSVNSPFSILGQTGSSYSYGGGVYVSGNFTMSGGTISGSSSAINGFINISEGGGVYVRGNFTMSGGTISGSSSSCGSSPYIPGVHSYGGGVFVYGIFIKTGGIIYGNDAPDTNKNTVSGPNAYGHAVYLDLVSAGYYVNNTLGESDNLSSTSPLPVDSGQTLNGWTKR